MLKLPENIDLSSRSIGYMKRWQEAIDTEPNYELQISKAKKSWGKSNKTFDEVKQKLRLMSNNTERCNYCEDSQADEVEHIYPKNIFPEKTFIWENYLYSCGQCNGPKSDRFALINGDQLIDITPPKPLPDDYVYSRPENHPVALIDPRSENPFHFIELDIFETFRFSPKSDINEDEKLRAKYTIDVLRLNKREYLKNGRESAYDNFRLRLQEYINQRDNGASNDRLDKIINGIKEQGHQTVWHEMIRFRNYINELGDLFISAPEALNW